MRLHNHTIPVCESCFCTTIVCKYVRISSHIIFRNCEDVEITSKDVGANMADYDKTIVSAIAVFVNM